MEAKVRIVTTTEGAHYGVEFHCPGCSAAEGGDETHVVTTPPYTGPCVWGWNGSLDRPTLTPSILVHPHGTFAADGVTVIQSPRCHSFVKDGRIQFLGDCTHPLANTTVDLPDW